MKLEKTHTVSKAKETDALAESVRLHVWRIFTGRAALSRDGSFRYDADRLCIRKANLGGTADFRPKAIVFFIWCRKLPLI